MLKYFYCYFAKFYVHFVTCMCVACSDMFILFPILLIDLKFQSVFFKQKLLKAYS